ncbi:MAG TPA: FAD-dependent oxidoreductase, partial [Polyangiales bacterium]
MSVWLLPVFALAVAGLSLRMRLITSAGALITRARRALRDACVRRVAARFGGYVHALNQPDPTLPLMCARAGADAPSVAVIGAGLAGLGAACDLAARGLRVTLLEKNPYLGGKIGAFEERAADGTVLEVEHGFHAFFRHYYNLQGFLRRTGVHEQLVPVDDYLILEAAGARWSFRDVESTPVLNLIALMRRGMFRLRDILFTRALHELDVFLAYDQEETFRELDQLSYAEFAARAELPARLRLVFNTFARTFFSDAERLSMAELVKSFHFYYLSHNHGLIYDYPAGRYQTTVLDPISRYLQAHGARVRLNTACTSLSPRDDGGFDVNGERFDRVVLACHAQAARALFEGSPVLQTAAPRLASQLRALPRGQRYAVWHLWLDRDVRENLPVFVSTERLLVLDAVAFCHRVRPATSEPLVVPGARAMLELHSYALPDTLDIPDLRAAFMRDLEHYFPELRGCQIVRESLQVKDDFTAFHVGAAGTRPETDTELPGLVLAGDWVRLPCP